MNLVNELQVSAVREDVLTVLRNTWRLASKLGRKDIGEWLENEQGGYSGQEVPDYRRIGVDLAYNTSEGMPTAFGRTDPGIVRVRAFQFDNPFAFENSISDVVQIIQKASASPQGGIFIPTRRPNFVLRHNDTQVRAIPERVKDHVLLWALALEEAGVRGDGMTFSAEDKERSSHVIFYLEKCNVNQLNDRATPFL